MDFERTILIYDSVEYFRSSFESKSIRNYPSFKRVNLLEKILRRMSLKFNLSTVSWYGKWKNCLSNVDTVIVFATNRFDYIQYIADNHPSLRIIVWYWNPVFRCFEPSRVKGENIEFWSFDKKDCQRYNLKFNSTFYFRDLPIEQRDNKWDLVFLGADKGRASSILSYEIILNNQGINTNFIVVPDKDSVNLEVVNPISYKEYIDLVGQSKAIFDFIQTGQSGLTLRPMESIFFKRKLVTNDQTIIHEPFYDPNNIFVLDNDNIGEICSFINSPYSELPEDIVNYYEFSNWLKRFDRYE